MVDTSAPVGMSTDVFSREPDVVEVHELHPRETAIVRATATMADVKSVIGDAFAEVVAACEKAGVGIAGPPFVRYLGWGGTIDMEVGFPVLRPAPTIGRVGPGQLPGGSIASIVHVGPYEMLHITYAKLQAWFETTGRTPGGVMWEVYWSDPEAERDPATWRTEILQPIA